MQVAGHRFDPSVCDADDRFRKVIVGKSRSFVKGTCAGSTATFNNSSASKLFHGYHLLFIFDFLIHIEVTKHRPPDEVCQAGRLEHAGLSDPGSVKAQNSTVLGSV
jgi:hypothetical protein